MGLEVRNSCHCGLAQQCEEGRSDTFEGNQFGSEEGKKDASCIMWTLWECQQGVSKHSAPITLCVLAASSFPWLQFVTNKPYKVLHDLKLWTSVLKGKELYYFQEV